MSTRWSIQLLGELRAAPAHEGRVVTRFRTQKTGALLAYLAYHVQRSHPRDVLIELLWPEGDPDAGRHSLSQALSSLRHQLEPPGFAAGSVIVADRATVRLDPAAVATDVAEFETALRVAAVVGSGDRLAHLTHAVELYRGAFLPGYYEDWILTEREWLADRYLTALSQLLAILEKGGDLHRALEYAQRGVRADPLREEAHAALMRLHAASGRPALALRQYRELERILKVELDEAPTERTRALAEQLRRPGGVVVTDPPETRVPLRSAAALERPGEGAREPAERRSGEVPSLEAAPPERIVSRRGRSRHGVSPPTGTVTFLLTSGDEAVLPMPRTAEARQSARARRDEVLRRQLRQYAGYEFPGSGEEHAGAFATAREALACAVASQRALAAESDRSETGMLPVRMALHTGEAAFEREEYRGPALEQLRRLAGAGHGGQILCSESTAALLRRAGPESIGAGLRLAELGIFRLHGSTTMEPLFQVEYPDMGERQFAPPRAEAGFTDILPLPLTRFFGREAEIAQLKALLAPAAGLETGAGGAPSSVRSLAGGTRLVTLTGAGGSGKTRLALEVARRSVAAYQGAVWFVSLADVVDPGRILEAVRDALHLPRSLDVEPLEQIAAAVSARPGLVLLDRFETLVGTGAATVRRLLERVSSLRCLITSRQRLDLAGEREFPLAPLPTPDVGVRAFGRSGVQAESPVGDSAPLSSLSPSKRQNAPTPEHLMQCESVQLFVDRAQGVRPDFQVTKANAAAVASLCRHLEGIPLALELAAGRAQALTPAQMVAHLKRRFDFLVSRQRDADPRHRTLRAAIDSSYELLSPELQRFFAWLSVFRGGWTLEAAAAIGDLGVLGQDLQSPEVLDYLEQLRECSLIEIEEEEEEGIRYRLLETLREYGWERLEERGETSVVLARHRDWFLALAERLDAIAHGPEQRRLLGRLEMEHDNLRAALDWCRTEGEAATEVRLAGALWKFWVGHGHISEGRSWLEDALRRDSISPPAAEEGVQTVRRLRALLGAGALAFYQGEYATAASHAARSEALARELGDAPGIALSLNILGSVEADRGLYDQATARFHEGLALARTCADTFGVALALHNLGAAEEAEGRYEEANTAVEASLNGFRELEDTWGMTLALGTLASVALRTGHHDRVRELCREVLDHSRRLGHAAGIARSLRYQGVVARHAEEFDEAARLLRESLAIQDTLGGQHIYTECLEEIAKVAAHQGDGTRAARLFGAAAALREALGVAVQPADRPDYDRCVGIVREQLSADGFTMAWSEGHGMSLQEAVAFALIHGQS
jgi:predicted ATPase/DNA-binding SARP family transcriptional activator